MADGSFTLRCLLGAGQQIGKSESPGLFVKAKTGRTEVGHGRPSFVTPQTWMTLK